MSDDLVAFLLARIAEDEQAARAAGSRRRWEHRGDDESNPWIVTAGDDVLIYDEGTPNDSQAAHIAHWDPARVLAECEAKRRIAEECQHILKTHISDDFSADVLAEKVLGYLASPYAGHPDCHAEWTTETTS